MVTNRKEFIIMCREKRMSYREIGVLLGITRQRVEQIFNNRYTYTPKEKHERKLNIKSVDKLKTWTKRKRVSLGLPDKKINIKHGGRDYIREIVRIRDNHTCQICGKKWNLGDRRFDVHHTDEKLEGRSNEKGIIMSDKKNLDKMITLCHKCHLNLDIVKSNMKKVIHRG